MSEALHQATQRLVRTVDAITAEEYAAPSGLPGWSRAHVVAHLALNAEGLAGALTGVLEGVRVPMYASPQARDLDIADLAAQDPRHLRDHLMSSTTMLADVLTAFDAVPTERLSTLIERTPGSERTFPAHAVASMRLREVEVHHADLGLAFTPHDWSADFCEALLDAMAERSGFPDPFTAAPTDIRGTWQCGRGEGAGRAAHGPVVAGTAADLGWWLTGRGEGAGLTSDSGTLPRIEEW